ncbi:hypothetical protein CUZ56_01739 [Saezia sanguinis]|uniref:Uncharacterized protein n=1 Tax=Saezia sanguinis TaxID=1965230 RepID=A0A433SCL0_9BURK|nr:PAAR domain-containing protein [Saezia sanguinis]RUS66460.1 hypothetical protein CUZ56_01739 [Saezia sanguinis]
MTASSQGAGGSSGGRPVVLVGHAHSCPKHGAGTVVTGTAGFKVNGRNAACVGDLISCGAVIVNGTGATKVNGRCVARQGDATSHGGVLIEGDASWMVK